MIRKIVHFDLDAFFCAVEEQRNPALVGKPFAVGGRPQERGVVSSCSYAARAFGVRSAMPMRRALRICPQLILVPPHYRDYLQASQKVMEKIRGFTLLVEQISIDEAFLDISDSLLSIESTAKNIQDTIIHDFCLPCSLGGATNKLVAKIATDVGKSSTRKSGPPNAITIISPGTEAAFLAPLPTLNLWGIGPKTAERLQKLGIGTIGELASTPEHELRQIFGRLAHEMLERAQGIDESPVITQHETKSISQETTFPRDITNKELLIKTLGTLSKRLANRLRDSNTQAQTIKLKIRWPDFTTISRQSTLSQPTDQEQVLHEIAIYLFEKTWKNQQPVRLIGLGVSRLGSKSLQLGLWDAEAKGIEINDDNLPGT